MITEHEILNQLDGRGKKFDFPMLDNGYVYPVTARLNCFGDGSRWAMIIEVFGFNYRAGCHNGASNALHVFGNCIDGEPGLENEDFVCVSGDSPEGATFDEFWLVSPGVSTFLLRGEIVTFDVSDSALELKGIPKVNEEEGATAVELFRSLLPEHREKLLATDKELRRRIPQDLPLVLRLEDWFHPDLANGEMPGQNATFQSLAKVLVAANPTLYTETVAPNTHWSNWPEGGTL